VAAFLGAVVVDGDAVHAAGYPNRETAAFASMGGHWSAVDGGSPSREIPARELDEG
jgi:hypothetical protein